MSMQIVSLVEEGDTNNDKLLSRDEHKVLTESRADHIKEVMMELQTKFMELMAKGRDNAEM
jgi:23S rRNA maturation mini-RNase III